MTLLEKYLSFLNDQFDSGGGSVTTSCASSLAFESPHRQKIIRTAYPGDKKKIKRHKSLKNKNKVNWLE